MESDGYASGCSYVILTVLQAVSKYLPVLSKKVFGP